MILTLLEAEYGGFDFDGHHIYCNLNIQRSYKKEKNGGERGQVT